MVDVWKNVLPKQRRDFTKNDTICENHFDPKDVIKNFNEHKNIELVIEKRATLRVGSVPCFFNATPTSVSISSEESNVLTVTKSVHKKEYTKKKSRTVRALSVGKHQRTYGVSASFFLQI